MLCPVLRACSKRGSRLRVCNGVGVKCAGTRAGESYGSSHWPARRGQLLHIGVVECFVGSTIRVQSPRGAMRCMHSVRVMQLIVLFRAPSRDVCRFKRCLQAGSCRWRTCTVECSPADRDSKWRGRLSTTSRLCAGASRSLRSWLLEHIHFPCSSRHATIMRYVMTAVVPTGCLCGDRGTFLAKGHYRMLVTHANPLVRCAGPKQKHGV